MNITPEERVAVISTKHGDMVVEFYPDVAPMHVESFITLAEEEYFNGTTFHRVIPGFVIQGGDPNSKLDNRALHGTGGRAGKFFGLGDENDPNSITLNLEVEEGKKYYFGDIDFRGNTVYGDNIIQQILGLKKGDTYMFPYIFNILTFEQLQFI